MTPAPGADPEGGGAPPAGEGPAAAVTARLAEVRDRIAAAGGDPARVTVVAVTKGFGADSVRAALAAGIRDVGENYAGELLAKSQEVGAQSPGEASMGAAGGAGEAASPPRWHYLGAVQRNKVARLAPVVTCWQSLCRAVEGRAIARHRPGASVLVQVDLAGLPGRGGVARSEVPGLVTCLRDEGVEVDGLMAVGMPGPPEASRRGFRDVVRLADELGLPVRSLGMSNDLEVAVGEGSTMVRIGRALFGARPVRPPRAVREGGS
ncbi:MAG TPA: YggS family pyridoxal phosphate enzyme [Acidimicrobiales bacterium]|nr:YggS family pyridoxal phosphate enzyme [Acidimicrobiales bacterium]